MEDRVTRQAIVKREGKLDRNRAAETIQLFDEDGDILNLNAAEADNGIPSGGDTGQILAKASGDDFDGEWIDAPTGGGSTDGITVDDDEQTVTLKEEYDFVTSADIRVHGNGKIGGGSSIGLEHPGGVALVAGPVGSEPYATVVARAAYDYDAEEYGLYAFDQSSYNMHKVVLDNDPRLSGGSQVNTSYRVFASFGQLAPDPMLAGIPEGWHLLVTNVSLDPSDLPPGLYATNGTNTPTGVLTGVAETNTAIFCVQHFSTVADANTGTMTQAQSYVIPQGFDVSEGISDSDGLNIFTGAESVMVFDSYDNISETPIDKLSAALSAIDARFGENWMPNGPAPESGTYVWTATNGVYGWVEQT